MCDLCGFQDLVNVAGRSEQSRLINTIRRGSLKGVGMIRAKEYRFERITSHRPLHVIGERAIHFRQSPHSITFKAPHNPTSSCSVSTTTSISSAVSTSVLLHNSRTGFPRTLSLRKKAFSASLASLIRWGSVESTTKMNPWTCKFHRHVLRATTKEKGWVDLRGKLCYVTS